MELKIIYISLFLILIIFIFIIIHNKNEKFSNHQHSQIKNYKKINNNKIHDSINNNKIHNYINNNKIHDYINNNQQLTHEIPIDTHTHTHTHTQDNKIITLYYATWCHHCHHILPFYNELISENNNSNIIFRKVESEELSNYPQEAEYVKGFPTIIIVYKNKNHIYDGSRDKKSLVEYINGLQ